MGSPMQSSTPRRAPRDDDAPLLPAAVVEGVALEAERATDVLVHEAPDERGRIALRIPVADAPHVERAVAAAAHAGRRWRASDAAARLELAARLARLIANHREALAQRMAREIGKPIADARSETTFALALIDAAILRARRVLAAGDPDPAPAGAAPSAGIGRGHERRRPLGTVAVVTPWNVPLAIPLGKLVPALLYGNAVVWKPAPAGSGVALDVLRLVHDSGFPPGVVSLLCGDHATAERLLSHPSIDAVTFTGSSVAGSCAQTICAARRVPLQAELGGNNAAIVWSDWDLDDAAIKVAIGAFGSAGQRCTANRRVVVDARCADALVRRLVAATDVLPWGDPLDDATRIGPLVSDAAAERVADAVERARGNGARVIVAPAHAALERRLAMRGAYLAPRIVLCDDPRDAVVQEETFGPVLVVQTARSFEEALARVNGVAQGLAAALFSSSSMHRSRFLDEARVGIVKIGSSTAGVGAEAPFGGWKASGVGPPEHGAGDPEFYTRAQAVYVDDPPSCDAAG